MAICRIALWAFRDREWPVPGTDESDLSEIREHAESFIEDGHTHFPHDNDIDLREFIDWANEILAA